MKELETKLIDLTNAKNCIEELQKMLKRKMNCYGDGDEEKRFSSEEIYYNNKKALQEINRRIEIINNAMDILEGIGE